MTSQFTSFLGSSLLFFQVMEEANQVSCNFTRTTIIQKYLHADCYNQFPLHHKTIHITLIYGCNHTCPLFLFYSVVVIFTELLDVYNDSEKGAQKPGREISGQVTLKQVYEIAKIKTLRNLFYGGNLTLINFKLIPGQLNWRVSLLQRSCTTVS